MHRAEAKTAAAGPIPMRRLDPRRVYAALVFVPFFYVLVRHFPPAAFFVLVVAAALLALLEFYRLHFRGEPPPVPIAIGLGAGALLLTSLQWPGLIAERGVLLLTVAAVLVHRLGSTRDLKQGLTDSAVLVFGVLYVALTLGHLLLTRALQDGEFLVFFLILVTWAGDTGAYYAGVSLGRHQLASVISPNKTFEGLVGGLASAVAAAFVARAWFLPAFSGVDCLATGLLLTVAGVAGDLAESAMKRGAGVKDTGGLIPGHGGLLDRLDSLLFTTPAFYYYVTVVK